MRIFLISRGYPTANSPQWGSFEKDHAEALAAIGHEVIMLSVDGRFRLFWQKHGLTRIQKNGVTAFNYHLIPTKLLRLLGKACEDAVLNWQWDKVYQDAVREFGKPDILYSHYLFGTYRAIGLKKKYHIPLVGIEHWSEVNKPVPENRVMYLGNRAYPYTDSMIAVCSTLKDALIKTFHIDATVIYNMVGPEYSFVPKPNTKEIKFVSTGSLIQRKGFDVAIKAFKAADIPKDTWHLDIIGGGEQRASLQKQIDESGLSANITLVGQKTKPEIVQYLQESHVFILSSRNENFSVAVLEALACGLPVISSVCGGIRECINKSNGVLFEVDDVDGLAGCIKDMIRNYSRYSPQQIASECQERFSPKVIARQLTGVFEQVLENKQ